MNSDLLIEKIVSWLKEQVKISNSKGLLVGVSGGIDSAVVAHLIKRACPDNSLGVIIPIHSSKSSLDDARKLIDTCSLKALEIDLSQSHRTILDLVFSSLKENQLLKEDYKKIADANLRARLRMSILYTIANNLGYMVVGTDNKDESYTGYFTKYGDGAVDIMPIANVFKSQVYEMAKILNVPKSIINKAPSADLWENQTDEEEMGVKYSIIESYIRGEKVDEKDADIIRKLHNSSMHKRTMPPKFEF